jgi:archaetidylinositol phosphate synthase
MASPMRWFGEQANPRSSQEKHICPDKEIRRIQQSWVADRERWALIRLAAQTPEWIGPDHLTALGLVAQIGAGVGYGLAGSNKYALLGVIACLALNWLGDSLDGTLARVRNRQRPRYGFYVDHMTDSFGAVALMGGLAISGYMSPEIAIGLLIGFLMLSLQSYLATHALGEFRLSFWRFGPTELRILLAIGNGVVLWKPRVLFLGRQYRLFDVGGTIGLIGMTLILVFFTAQNTVRLYGEARIEP